MSDGSKAKKNTMRKNQLFGPWGVGSIMPCPDGSSIMIAGLDAFPSSGGRMDFVDDSRLARHVGVKKLLSPPVGMDAVPAIRFPHWLYCPSCKNVYSVGNFQQSNLYCQNKSCKNKLPLVPERFVVACPEGHIDDLPIMEWVHGHTVSNPEEHQLKRKTQGGSASLGDIKYECVTCGKSRSLKGITKPGALEECGYSCTGNMPWIDKKKTGCSQKPEDIRVIQRGGTNAWYADVVSSIYIPEVTDPELAALINSRYDKLEKYASKGDAELDEYITDTIEDETPYSLSDIKRAFLEMKANAKKPVGSDSDFREVEYKTLLTASVSTAKKGTFEGVSLPIQDYKSSLLQSVAESITLVTTLKETRALVGFTRLYPDLNEEKSYRERRSALSSEELDWTLGVQLTGEGIFIAFQKEAIRDWLTRRSVGKRIRKLQRNFHLASSKKSDVHTLNPEYVFIHSLSHVLMLGLTKECGYSTSSVRERIYCDKYLDESDRHPEMLGLLIYTASDDSEGSLGGLVRAGRPGRFEAIFDRSLVGVCWCSCDPVCIESPGQGPGSCNLAACYSCSLVPETACETGNRLLDRALLAGTIASPDVGFFGPYIRDGASLPKYIPNEESQLATSEDYTVSIDNPFDISDEEFSGVCEFVLYDASPDEEALLVELGDLGDTNNLEKPVPEAIFKKGSLQAEASLVWSDKKIALLTHNSEQEFITTFGGDYKVCTTWKFICLNDDKAIVSLVELLIGEE